MVITPSGFNQLIDNIPNRYSVIPNKTYPEYLQYLITHFPKKVYIPLLTSIDNSKVNGIEPPTYNKDVEILTSYSIINNGKLSTVIIYKINLNIMYNIDFSRVDYLLPDKLLLEYSDNHKVYQVYDNKYTDDLIFIKDYDKSYINTFNDKNHTIRYFIIEGVHDYLRFYYRYNPNVYIYIELIKGRQPINEFKLEYYNTNYPITGKSISTTNKFNYELPSINYTYLDSNTSSKSNPHSKLSIITTFIKVRDNYDNKDEVFKFNINSDNLFYIRNNSDTGSSSIDIYNIEDNKITLPIGKTDLCLMIVILNNTVTVYLDTANSINPNKLGTKIINNITTYSYNCNFNKNSIYSTSVFDNILHLDNSVVLSSDINYIYKDNKIINIEVGKSVDITDSYYLEVNYLNNISKTVIPVVKDMTVYTDISRYLMYYHYIHYLYTELDKIPNVSPNPNITILHDSYIDYKHRCDTIFEKYKSSISTPQSYLDDVSLLYTYLVELINILAKYNKIK